MSLFKMKIITERIEEKILYILIIASTVISIKCSINIWNISMLAKGNGNMLYYYIMITILCLVGSITALLGFISYKASIEMVKLLKSKVKCEYGSRIRKI